MNQAKLTLAILIAICILATSLLYAVWPFIQKKPVISRSPLPTIVLPYISSQPQDLDIQLNSYILNPVHSPNPSIDPRLNSQLLPHPEELYLIQYKTNTGASTFSLAQFDTNTQLAQLTPSQLRSLTQNPDINFITHYHPAYKLHVDLNQYLNQIPPLELEILITTNPGIPSDEVIQQILRISPDINITDQQNLPAAHILTLQIPSNHLISLAQLTSIIWIQPNPLPTTQ